MSDNEARPPGNETGLTATVTGFIIAICSFFTAHSTPEVKTIIPIMAGIAAPFLAALILRWQRKIEEPSGLTDFLAAYENDLKYQEKALKNTNLSKAVRTQLEKKHSETMIKMATAHQDFRSGDISVSTTSSVDK